jgi:cytochrome c-type biogenesis protein CcmH/NrfG
MTTGSKHIFHAVLMVALLAGPAAAVPQGSAAAAESLSLCDAADALPEAQRNVALARGEALAKAALAADRNDGRAHFALFCHLGRRMKHAGLGFSQLFDLRRLKREINAAQRLAPDDADVLAAKGALLLELPRLFGGDPAEAERLLRRALVVEPDNTDARCYLAAALRARGESPVDAPPNC